MTTVESDAYSRIETVLDDLLDEAGRAGSTSVVLVDGPQQVIVERGTKVDGRSPVNQLYQLGSLSKLITALGSLLLAEEGGLALDEPLRGAAELLPKFAGESVSICPRDILHHFSGLNIRSFTGYERGSEGRFPTLPERLSGRSGATALAFGAIPLTRVRYSSGAFGLLQVEIQSSHPDMDPIAEAVEQFAPGAKIVTDRPDGGPQGAPSGFVHPVVAVPCGSLHFPETYSQGYWMSPVSFSEVLRKLGRLIRDHSDGGRGPGAALVEQLLNRNRHPRMAMSVLVDDYGSGPILRHQGSNAGFTTQYISDPLADRHLVLATSGPLTSGELDLLAQRIFPVDSTAPMSAFTPHESSPAPYPRVATSYTNSEMTVTIGVDFAVLRSVGGFTLTLRKHSDGAYRSANSPGIECVIFANTLRVIDHHGRIVHLTPEEIR